VAIIRLKDLLKEFEYGDKLFADIEDENLINPEFLGKLIAKPEEENTDDEKKLLKALNTYFSKGVLKTIDASILKKLLKLKTKFPKILDPSASAKKLKHAYRGTTIGIDTLLKAINNGNLSKAGYKTYVIENPQITIQSKGSTGYLSFSTEMVHANAFAYDVADGSKIKKLIKQGLVPITAEVSLNANFLFNPEFIMAFSNYEEDETLLIDTEYTPSAIYMTDPLKLHRPDRVIRDLDNLNFTVDPGYYELKNKLYDLNTGLADVNYLQM
jgi:hypothetical protein